MRDGHAVSACSWCPIPPLTHSLAIEIPAHYVSNVACMRACALPLRYWRYHVAGCRLLRTGPPLTLDGGRHRAPHGLGQWLGSAGAVQRQGRWRKHAPRAHPIRQPWAQQGLAPCAQPQMPTRGAARQRWVAPSPPLLPPPRQLLQPLLPPHQRQPRGRWEGRLPTMPPAATQPGRGRCLVPRAGKQPIPNHAARLARWQHGE